MASFSRFCPMSANSNLRDEMRFQLRWDFRRGDSDFDTSSNDSKLSLGGEPDHKRHKPSSSSVPVDNNETIKFQHKASSIDPVDPAKTENGKAVKGKRGRSKRGNATEKKTVSRRVVRKKKIETNAALDDLKRHMNSLLEELKVTRKNMLSWMREEMKKLAAEEKASLSETKKDGSKGEEVELQHHDNSAQIRYPNLFGKNIEIPHQNSFEEHVQVHNPMKFEENALMQNLINLEDDIETQPQTKTEEKVQTSAKKANHRVYKRANKRKKSAEQQVDQTHAIVLVKPDEDGEKKSTLPENLKMNSKSDPLVEKVQPIVLGIKAQNRKVGSSAMKRALKAKKAADPNNQCQVPDYQLGYNQLERSRLSFEPNYSYEPFTQVASSMYLTLPSVLAKSQTPNFRPEMPAFSYIPSGNSSEKSNLMIGSGSHLGYFQPEERSRNYTPMGFRDISFFNHSNALTSSLGNGFPVPLHPRSNHFDLENSNRPNLTKNVGSGSGSGSVRLSGGNYSLAESYNMANNFQIPSNYRTDGRLVSYQDSNRFPK